MASVIAWVRGNPVSVGSALLSLLAVVGLLYVRSRGEAFVDRMGERDRVIKQIRLLSETPVRTPPADPNEPEEHHSIAVNQAAIDTLTMAYDRMDGEYREIFELAVGVNRHNHEPMVDGLFPEPESDYKPFDAKSKYRSAFERMLGPWSPGQDEPRLNAGLPTEEEELQLVVSSTTTEFLETFFPPKSMEQLTTEERDELKLLQRQKVIEAMHQHAGGIHVYVDTLDLDDRRVAFDLDEWSLGDRRPDMAEIWEGQIGLWIQQDIVEAIARANDVDDPGMSVLHAPVKRLVSIRIDPEGRYVGADRLRRQGEGSTTARVKVAGRSKTVVLPPGGGARAGSGGSAADQRLPYDFGVAATGRTSNDLYDVWHASVKLVVDWQQLPELLEQIQQVNFMTVLELEAVNVDEYEALREGMVYGRGDAVEVRMLIESIWLREWTKALMPKDVWAKLGIVEDG